MGTIFCYGEQGFERVIPQAEKDIQIKPAQSSLVKENQA